MPDDPSPLARQLSPEHPLVVRANAMREVGDAAASSLEVPPSVWARLKHLVVSEPLAIDPLLVSAATAERAGNDEKAAALLALARARDPRSPAVRYLLADLDLRSGRVAEGLREVAALSRVVPGSAVEIVPGLAQFARSPGAAAELRRLFADNPQLEDPVLTILAGDPRNSALILSVAGRGPTTGEPRRWPAKLLNAMMAAGDYLGAYSTWQQIVGPEARTGGVFNPEFRTTAAPPPFNWKFESTDAGIAQPEDGSLRVLFYGRDDGVLASETLMLTPGDYRLRVPVTVAAGPSAAVAWTITCLPSKSSILQLPLPGGGATRTLEGAFTVAPQGCVAQRLSLVGRAQDSPQTVDLEVRALDLERVGG